VRCQLEELHQYVVGRFDVMPAGIGLKAEPTEQVMLELGCVFAIPCGYRMRTHASFPSLPSGAPLATAVFRLSTKIS